MAGRGPSPGGSSGRGPADARAAAADVARAAKRAVRRLSGLVSDIQAGGAGAYGGSVAAAESRLAAGVGRSPDVVLRRITAGGPGGARALVAFVDGLVDARMVDEDLVRAVQAVPPAALPEHPSELAAAVARHVSIGHGTRERRWSALMGKLLAGNALLFLDGCPDVLVWDTVKLPARAIDRPDTEQSVRGGQEAFNSVVLTQMNQMRRMVQSERLVFAPIVIGRISRTQIIVCYLEGVTNPALVSAVRARLERLQPDAVLSHMRVAAAIRDHPWTPFPLVRSSERVDFAAREVMNGRVAVLVENVPFAAIVPATFIDFFRTSMDYNFSFWEASLTRIIRLAGFLIGLYAPAFYVALTSVEPDLMPSKLLLSVAGAREGVPFPPVVEVVLMFGIIELLREAAIRLPKSMNQTIGTVGAIVIGTSIVSAGLVSDQMIVLVTLTAVSVFTAPAWEMTVAMRWLIWPMVLGAYVMGVYGMVLVTLLIVQHMASLTSLGVPYLTPYGPWRPKDMADAWTRAAATAADRRPQAVWPIHSAKGDGATRGKKDVPLRRALRRWR